MRRWPLSTAAFLIVLAAHMAVAVSDEPVVMRGRIEHGRSWDLEERGYDLQLSGGPRRPRYPLLPTSGLHHRLLAKDAGTRREVEVVGTMSCAEWPTGREPYIIVETIEELP